MFCVDYLHCLAAVWVFGTVGGSRVVDVNQNYVVDERNTMDNFPGSPCDNKAEIFPCTCKNSTTGNMYVTCDGILDEATVHRALHAPGYGPNPLTGFSMRHGMVRTLSVDLFSQVSFKEVAMDNNHIELIEEGALEPLKQHATAIYLNNNRLTSTPLHMILDFTQLHNIVVSYNSIEDISVMAGYEGQSGSVESLHLSGNLLTSVPGNVFRAFPNLFAVNLDHNNISFIDREAFNHLPRLQYIDLSYNHLNQLGSAGVGQVVLGRPIRGVYLEGCGITNLLPGFVTGLGDPSLLVLDHNPMRTFPEEVFGELMANFTHSTVPYQGVTLFNNWLDCDCDFLWVARQGAFGSHLRGGHCGTPNNEPWTWVALDEVNVTALEIECQGGPVWEPEEEYDEDDGKIWW